MTKNRKRGSSFLSKGCLFTSLAALVIIPLIGFAVFFGALVRIGGTWNSPTGNGAAATDSSSGVYTVGPNCQEINIIRTTVYLAVPSSQYSSSSQAAIEGGQNDAQGKPLQTLDKYLTGAYASSGSGDYSSLAADLHSGDPGHYTYGTPAYIPAVENSSLVGGKQINFKIVDTGQDFGPNATTAARRNNPNQYIDIAVSNSGWVDSNSLNLSNVAMYYGSGCTRSNISNQSTTMQAFKEKALGTCNQVAVYTAAYYLAQQKGGNPSKISFPNFPVGTCATDQLLAQELEQAGFSSGSFAVHRQSEDLPNGSMPYWGTVIPMLRSDEPVVMETNLYSDQVNQHWVTLASASPDGQTISYADPAKGTIQSMSISNGAWGHGSAHAYIYVTWNN